MLSLTLLSNHESVAPTFLASTAWPRPSLFSILFPGASSFSFRFDQPLSCLIYCPQVSLCFGSQRAFPASLMTSYLLCFLCEILRNRKVSLNVPPFSCKKNVARSEELRRSVVIFSTDTLRNVQDFTSALLRMTVDGRSIPGNLSDLNLLRHSLDRLLLPEDTPGPSRAGHIHSTICHFRIPSSPSQRFKTHSVGGQQECNEVSKLN
jgi:hypothetical protein